MYEVLLVNPVTTAVPRDLAVITQSVVVGAPRGAFAAKGAGELILAVLAQVADMERQKIKERTEAGRQAARESLARTGLTHKGKASLGRPAKRSADEVTKWRQTEGASLSKTAEHFGLSLATVKRYCAQNQPLAKEGTKA